MKTVGIICEYNPLHLGHQKQLRQVREASRDDCAIVCLMSGNYVQRGAPAIWDKSLRASAAVACGADLVLELPVTYALSSAEGFASGGVRILSSICQELSFGCESGSAQTLMDTARALLSPDFPPLLRESLESGVSFPAARAAALERMGQSNRLLAQPNDILAVEYCKAIVSQNSALQPIPILRQGSYHDRRADPENPSATAVREILTQGGDWTSFVPAPAVEIFRGAALHTLASGETAILAKLRTMTEEEFHALPYGSEGLWRKLMHASRSQASLQEIIDATKSKRYTRTRIDRMILCAFLGITEEILSQSAPYCRVLAFNDKGRTVLKQAKKDCAILNPGEDASHSYQLLEQRCGDLYGLFAQIPEPPGAEKRRRVCIHK